MPQSNSEQKKDFFISYNHHDQQWAEWIAWQLEEAGYTTVIQAWDFGVGRNFVTEMQVALADTRRTIAVMSPAYLESGFAGAEWKEAFARDAAGTEGTLVQVKVALCEPPGVLRQIVWIDLVDKPEEAARGELLRKLRDGRSKPSTPPPFPGQASQAASPPPFPGRANPEPVRLARPTDPRFLFVGVPDLPREFVGREAILDEVIRTLVSGESVALSAEGMGGVGKTTLAVAIAHHPVVQAHFSGVLWAGLGLEPDPASALASWAEALGVDLTGVERVEERRERLQRALVGERMLLVIDDAWDLLSAKALKCGGPGAVHVITTRNDSLARGFAGSAGVVKVPVLDDEAALALLVKLAPEACEIEIEAVRRLVQAVGALPLGIEVVGAYLGSTESRYFREDREAALTALADPRVRLEQACRRLGQENNVVSTVRECIRLSLENLPPDTVETFFCLGAFAPKPESFTREAAIAVSSLGTNALALLIDHNLLSMSGQLLQIHQVVSDVANEQLQSSATERHKRYYLNKAESLEPEWRAMEAVYGQFTWAFRRETELESMMCFLTRAKWYQERRWLGSDFVSWANRALSVAEKEGNRALTAELLTELAWMHFRLHQPTLALEHAERALTVLPPDAQASATARIYSRLGLALARLRRFPEAIAAYKNGLTLVSGDDKPYMVGSLLGNLGAAQVELGMYDLSIKTCEAALNLLRPLGDTDSYGAALNTIGVANNGKGAFMNAVEWFSHSLEIVLRMGDLGMEDQVRRNIALSYSRARRYKEAVECYEQVLELSTRVASRCDLAVAYARMSFALYETGDFARAIDYFRKAYVMEHEDGVAYLNTYRIHLRPRPVTLFPWVFRLITDRWSAWRQVRTVPERRAFKALHKLDISQANAQPVDRRS